jgi:hypothetical protein
MVKYELHGRHINQGRVKVRKERKGLSLEEKIEEDKEVRKMDCGKLSKLKKPSTSLVDHLMENKERWAGEALKTWVNWT